MSRPVATRTARMETATSPVNSRIVRRSVARAIAPGGRASSFGTASHGPSVSKPAHMTTEKIVETSRALKISGTIPRTRRAVPTRRPAGTAFASALSPARRSGAGRALMSCSHGLEVAVHDADGAGALADGRGHALAGSCRARRRPRRSPGRSSRTGTGPARASSRGAGVPPARGRGRSARSPPRRARRRPRPFPSRGVAPMKMNIAAASISRSSSAGEAAENDLLEPPGAADRADLDAASRRRCSASPRSGRPGTATSTRPGTPRGRAS